MRIVGGKDYYDHGLAFGRDETITFIRTGREIRDDEFPVVRTGCCPDIQVLGDDRPEWRRRHDNPQQWIHRGRTLKYESVHVVLCGRYYSGVRVFHTSRPVTPYDLKDWEMDTFWDEESLEKFLRKHGARVKPPEERKERRRIWREQREFTPFDQRDLTADEKSAIIDLRVTVATSTSEDIKNIGDGTGKEYRFWKVDADTLRTVQFIRVMDPVRAFQEISMWVGGVLPRPGNPMVQIMDEKIRQHKAGMDKTSFRKAPEKAR